MATVLYSICLLQRFCKQRDRAIASSEFIERSLDVRAGLRNISDAEIDFNAIRSLDLGSLERKYEDILPIVLLTLRSKKWYEKSQNV